MLEFLPHKKMGYCKICGEPIWAGVWMGSGCYAHNLCNECANKMYLEGRGKEIELVRFDYAKVSEEDKQEYKEWISKKEKEYDKE